jgi:phospholipid transport system substrate-binding protein
MTYRARGLSTLRTLSALAIAIAITLLALPAALAADGAGTKAVRKANETIAGLLEKKVTAGSDEEKKLATKVTTSVRDFLDIDALGKRALVDHWSTLSGDQQQKYMKLLRSLIEENYIKGLRANVSYEVVYTGENKNKDGNVVVTTEIKTERKGRPHTIAVDYVLVEDGGKLRAFDVVTDGVGLVENYRSQFNRIIEKEGFDGLIKRMEKKSANTVGATP